jgi:hypothetical protein
MNHLLTLSQHDKIGIYIAVPLVMILFVIAVFWALNQLRDQHKDYERWEQEMNEYFKRKDYEDD